MDRADDGADLGESGPSKQESGQELEGGRESGLARAEDGHGGEQTEQTTEQTQERADRANRRGQERADQALDSEKQIKRTKADPPENQTGLPDFNPF